MEPKKIDSLLNGIRIKMEGPRIIIRVRYMPYKLSDSMQLIEAIGKERSPKFRLDSENTFLFENLVRWVHGDEEFHCLDPKTKKVIKGNLNAGIYITGSTGTGKSWAMEIISYYANVDSAIFRSSTTSAHSLVFPCYRTDTICDEYSRSGILDNVKYAPIVCYQDLASDSEQKESMYMGNRLPVMQNILENRGDRKDLITMVTSNLPFTHPLFLKRYGDRVVSRLYEMCNYFELIGIDRREIK